jgi:hypothetical protein
MVPGMAEQLRPIPLLQDLHSNAAGAAVIRITSVHAARDVASRAAGLLLMAQVLGAAGEGTRELHLDVPELLAGTFTQVACDTSSCKDGMQSWYRPLWKHAAVLSVACGGVLAAR